MIGKLLIIHFLIHFGRLSIKLTLERYFKLTPRRTRSLSASWSRPEFHAPGDQSISGPSRYSQENRSFEVSYV